MKDVNAVSNTNKKVYISGLNPETTNKKILDFFYCCGKIVEVKILTDDDGKLKGTSIVKFDSTFSLLNALKLSGNDLDNMVVKITPAKEKKKRYRRFPKVKKNLND